jgi:hypothetical protein
VPLQRACAPTRASHPTACRLTFRGTSLFTLTSHSASWHTCPRAVLQITQRPRSSRPITPCGHMDTIPFAAHPHRTPATTRGGDAPPRWLHAQHASPHQRLAFRTRHTCVLTLSFHAVPSCTLPHASRVLALVLLNAANNRTLYPCVAWPRDFFHVRTSDHTPLSHVHANHQGCGAPAHACGCSSTSGQPCMPCATSAL